MADRAEPTFTTYIGDGELVVLPATIDGIRAALPPERHAAFDTAVGTTHAEELLAVLQYWAQETSPELRAFQYSVFERLERGDDSGFIPAEEMRALLGHDSEGPW
ncbi:hypothetical protein [Streptomyces uncialis]|uniref:hypothetical protein n=1 Tax=Streptomyces uncialis TaxID=1048205 RepID=UPI0038649316|nr:hypothetical protein OG268_13705 [Streptomyces uncialis]